MNRKPAIAIAGTFDSKGEEHLFLKNCIEQRGFRTLTVNLGTKGPSPFVPDIDLYEKLGMDSSKASSSRDEAIEAVLKAAQETIKQLYGEGEINGIISAGGGTGTHLGASVMRVLPLGVPKVMVSTVASRNMAKIVGTKDITMIHSVVDLLGVNSLSGQILEKAAGAICGMVEGHWKPQTEKKRIALTFFGFITPGAESVKTHLEGKGYEVVAFHANGTGGMAMEELAEEGYFHGILDFGTHELADQLMDGYCAGIGPGRLLPVPGREIPRLVVPGGLDCAVLEFTRDHIPDSFKDRKIFFYDFRSAIRLSSEETGIISDQLIEKLNQDPLNVKVLIPLRGWSEADSEGGPLRAPEISGVLTRKLKQDLDPEIELKEANLHINDPAFARIAADMMVEMLLSSSY